MKAGAHIRPLKGKYYGTEVVIPWKGNQCVVTVWHTTDDPHPSGRQLKDWNMTEAEAREDDMMCDSHYESAAGYEIAVTIANAFGANL